MSGELMTSRFASRADPDALDEVAHELRLPLSHIKGFVTSLRRADVEWDEETRRDFLEVIDLETDRLAQLGDSLLPATTLSGVAPGADLAFTDPAAVLNGALHPLRPGFGGQTRRAKPPAPLPSLHIDASPTDNRPSTPLHNPLHSS